MNIAGFGASPDVRRFDSRRTAPQSDYTVRQRPESQTRLPVAPTGSRIEISLSLAASLNGSDGSAGLLEHDHTVETTESDSDTSITENATECSNEPGDFFNDCERFDEQIEEQEEQTEEQHRNRGQGLDRLETGYRSRFMVLDRLCDRLTVTCNGLTHWMDEGSNKL